MILHTPSPTPTYTRFPYTTLFRSRPTWPALVLLQHPQQRLRDLVGLGDRRDGRLAQHLVGHQLALLGRQVDVHDRRLGRADVLQRGRDLLTAVLETGDQRKIGRAHV